MQVLSGANFVTSLDIVDACMTSPRFPLQKAPKSRTHSLTSRLLLVPVVEFDPDHAVPFCCCSKLAKALKPEVMEAVRKINFPTADIGQLYCECESPSEGAFLEPAVVETFRCQP